MKTQLVIFGITGDLSRRKLLPALAEIVQAGEGEDLSILGVSRRNGDVAELVQSATNNDVLAGRTSLFTMDLAEPRDYRRLKEQLEESQADQTLIYLAVPPGAAAQIVDLLGEAGINAPNVKLLFEKPFGFDLDSAQDFIDRTSRNFSEDQIYRIDHYMAKEVAQEVIRLRRDAANHHHAWSNQSVANIDVIASETIGIEDRAVFYEQTGALRDFIQGHLMQLLALVLMALPTDFSEEDIPSYRQAALSDVEPASPADAIRGQYEGYQTEAGNPGSRVETFADIPIVSRHASWQGVGITLTTGKNLDKKRASITITYKDGTQDIFEEGAVKAEGRLPDAYERVLTEAINGRKYLFTTSPEVLESWRILAPVQEAWAMDQTPLVSYQPGATIEDVKTSERYI